MQSPKKKHAEFTRKNIEVLVLPSQHEVVDLQVLLEELGKRDITSLLVEGGMQVAAHFIREKLVNKLHIYLATNIIGDLPIKHQIQSLDITKLDSGFFFNVNV